jgi:hypothetical protein
MSIVLQSSSGGQITIQEPATASNFTATLPAVNGTVLTTGNIPAGSVLQVVSAITSVSADYTTATPTSRVSLSITPISTSSRIMLFYNAGDCVGNGTTNVNGATAFYRNGSSIRSVTQEVCRNFNGFIVIAGSFLDSPSSTSALTYAVFHWNNSASGTFRVGDSGMPSVLTVMEIAG